MGNKALNPDRNCCSFCFRSVKVSADMHEKGYISRAEHEESIKGKKRLRDE